MQVQPIYPGGISALSRGSAKRHPRKGCENVRRPRRGRSADAAYQRAATVQVPLVHLYPAKSQRRCGIPARCDSARVGLPCANRYPGCAKRDPELMAAIPSGCEMNSRIGTGGIAALNHRLIAGNPSGSISVCAPSGSIRCWARRARAAWRRSSIASRGAHLGGNHPGRHRIRQRGGACLRSRRVRHANAHPTDSRTPDQETAKRALAARDGETIRQDEVRSALASRNRKLHDQAGTRFCTACPHVLVAKQRDRLASADAQHHDSQMVGFLQSRSERFY